MIQYSNQRIKFTVLEITKGLTLKHTENEHGNYKTIKRISN